MLGGCAALGGLAAVAAGAFHAVDATAGLLLLPFVGWTCFATALMNCALATGDEEVAPLPQQAEPCTS